VSVKPKKIPVRTCVGCGSERPKREMVRVVRRVDGTVAVDPTGKASGRGAYVCPNPACLDQARRRGRLERGLELAPGSIGEAVWQALAQAVAAPSRSARTS
jgi:predicted RNA-binding protein YlxR (DUF448 family)